RHAWLQLELRSHYRQGAIRRAVVGQDQLELGVVHAQQALEAGHDGRLFVVGRDDETDREVRGRAGKHLLFERRYPPLPAQQRPGRQYQADSTGPVDDKEGHQDRQLDCLQGRHASPRAAKSPMSGSSASGMGPSRTAATAGLLATTVEPWVPRAMFETSLANLSLCSRAARRN